MPPAIASPKTPQIVVSILVIAGNLYVLSWVFAILALLEPCSFFSGLFLMPLPAALATSQYLGTFRGYSTAAAIAGLMLQIVRVVAVFALFVILADAVGNQAIKYVGVAVNATVLTILVTSYGCQFNREWEDELDAAQRAESSGSAWRMSIMELVGLIAAISFVLGMARANLQMINGS